MTAAHAPQDQIDQEAADSLARQTAVEAADDIDFPTFLDRYFGQT